MAQTMKEELVMREDDQLRDERYRRDLPVFKRVLWTIFIATPILVGCMYLLMQGLPKEAFPPHFWAKALSAPILSLAIYIGGYCLVIRFVHRKWILSAKGIRLAFPENQYLLWRRLTEWRVEDSREHPGHFTVELRTRGTWRRFEITLPSTYSKDEVRFFIQFHLAKAF